MTLNDSIDVIVVGSGGAGLAAALDAMKQGASVTVVEREAEMGGATIISGGGCFIVGTPLQAEKASKIHRKRLWKSGCDGARVLPMKSGPVFTSKKAVTHCSIGWQALESIGTV